MAHASSRYLSENVLNDGKIVTYRTLSRALQIHNDEAKRLLSEFYSQQNFEKAKPVHATYLLTGTQTSQQVAIESHQKEAQNGSREANNVPGLESEFDDPSRCLVTIAREEDLDQAKTRYKNVTSVHIYSLQPSSIKNLQALSNSNQQLSVDFVHEDKISAYRIYGPIQNKAVKRREGEAPVSVPIAPSRAHNDSASPGASDRTRIRDQQLPDQQPPSQGNGPKKSEGRPLLLKREKSDILQSFAKVKTKAGREDTDPKTSTAEKQPEEQQSQADVSMEDASDDQSDERWDESQDEGATALRDARLDRERKLQEMMEQDDDDNDSEGQAENGEMHESDQLEMSAINESKTDKSEDVRVTSTSGGRRRGKRKVMKKVRMKDEEGYLVTREEAAWESFSEEEPSISQRPKELVADPKPKKPTSAKGAQGNIMSFFGRL